MRDVGTPTGNEMSNALIVWIFDNERQQLTVLVWSDHHPATQESALASQAVPLVRKELGSHREGGVSVVEAQAVTSELI